MKCNPKVSVSFLAKLRYEYMSGSALVGHNMKSIPAWVPVCKNSYVKSMICVLYMFSHTSAFSSHQREQGVAGDGEFGGGGSKGR